MTAVRSRRTTAPPRPPTSTAGPAHTLGPPVLALVVSSPAILAALDGRMDPLLAIAIVAGALIACWTLGAVGIQMWQDAAVPDRGRGASHDGASHEDPGTVLDPPPELVPAGGVALGQIEPIQVPAHEAVAGTPEYTPSTMEGPIR